MKTRSGFVSNSSSSSFVIITTKEKWISACQTFSEKVGENMASVVIAEYGKGKNAKVMGQDAIVFQGIMSTEEFGSEGVGKLEREGKVTEEEAEKLTYTAYEHIGDLEDILKKDGVSYTSSTGC